MKTASWVLAILLVAQGIATTTSAVTIPADQRLVVAISNNRNRNGPVLGFDIPTPGPLILADTIAPPNNKDPVSATYNHGQLFVGNRYGNVGGGAGSVTRFAIQSGGTFAFVDEITGNGLEAVHQVAISPDGELFAANLLGDVSRFKFAPDGSPIANGIISHPGQTLGVAFSQSGELFVSSNTDVQRFVFDSGGNAIPNGDFSVPGFVHFLAFSPWGELFVAEGGGSLSGSVQRFVFDSSGTAIPNGSFVLPNGRGALGLAFTPMGDLFVSAAANGFLGGGINRYHFDLLHNAIFDDFTTLDQPAGMAFVPEPSSFVLAALGCIASAAWGWRRKR